MERLSVSTNSSRMVSWKVMVADWLLDGMYSEIKENAFKLFQENARLTEDLAAANIKIRELEYRVDRMLGKKKTSMMEASRQAKERRGK